MLTKTARLALRIADAAKRIRMARAAGVVIDTGNVVDLLADNFSWSIAECREAVREVQTLYPGLIE